MGPESMSQVLKTTEQSRDVAGGEASEQECAGDRLTKQQRESSCWGGRMNPDSGESETPDEMI